MPIAVRTAEPLVFLQQRLADGSDFFIRTLKGRNLYMSEENLEKNLIPVFTGEKTRIPHSAIPALRIVPVRFSPSWLANRTRSDEYRFYIDCMVRTTVEDVIDEYVMVLSLAVTQWLLDFEKLQPEICEANRRAYDSWTDGVEFGYSKGQAWRIARISYWLKMVHAYSGNLEGMGSSVVNC